MKTRHYFTALALAIALPALGHTADKEIIIDTVVASVDGKPITLLDVEKRLEKPRSLNVDDASYDPEVRFTLDQIIMEHLIVEEAHAKNFGVSDPEINSYIDDVAAKNGLSREGFEAALKQEGISTKNYRERIKVDILKSKLASSMVQGGVGISDEEIQSYIDSNPALSGSGSKVKLSQIFISFSGRSENEAWEEMNGIKGQLDEGTEFAKLASEFSESPEGVEGGSLGVIPENDLSGIIFDAIYTLDEGQVSEVTSSPRGLHIFLLEERYSEEDEDDDDEKSEALYAEAREALKRQKLQTRMQSFFTSDLYESHSVDKKI